MCVICIIKCRLWWFIREELTGETPHHILLLCSLKAVILTSFLLCESVKKPQSSSFFLLKTEWLLYLDSVPEGGGGGLVIAQGRTEHCLDETVLCYNVETYIKTRLHLSVC